MEACHFITTEQRYYIFGFCVLKLRSRYKTEGLEAVQEGGTTFPLRRHGGSEVRRGRKKVTERKRKTLRKASWKEILGELRGLFFSWLPRRFLPVGTTGQAVSTPRTEMLPWGREGAREMRREQTAFTLNLLIRKVIFSNSIWNETFSWTVNSAFIENGESEISCTLVGFHMLLKFNCQDQFKHK